VNLIICLAATLATPSESSAPLSDKGFFSGNWGSVYEKIEGLFSLHSHRVLAGMCILFFGWILARIVKVVLGKIMTRAKIDPTLVAFTRHLSFYAMMLFVLLAALNKFGVQTTSMIAVVGAAGLAVGLALQGALSNFAAGILLILFRPFRVGDMVGGGGVEGVVDEIGILTTELNAPDNRKLIVPNAKLLSDSIVNYTGNGTRRVDLKVGIAYDADISKARQAILDLLAADRRILDDPKTMVVVCELGDSSVNLSIRPWCKVNDYWDVYFESLEAIKNRLDSEGISIPFPQRDVHIYDEKSGKS